MKHVLDGLSFQGDFVWNSFLLLLLSNIFGHILKLYYGIKSTFQKISYLTYFISLPYFKHNMQKSEWPLGDGACLYHASLWFRNKKHCLFGVLIPGHEVSILKYFIRRFCLPNVVLAPFPPEKNAFDCQQAIKPPMNPYGVEEPQRKIGGGEHE